ncbi:hypothetical protein LSCM1_07835 [Leishmania martiniquensis]|uniref:Helicase C-terminal domain-containing protein n=1 Tax=Leishmania martiniquensis TaxID=1580590 RepID=A0A836HUG0_9TRYP|nr:hypothetical protein LSCM1_07835 [Leishmania martiniquensis]
MQGPWTSWSFFAPLRTVSSSRARFVAHHRLTRWGKPAAWPSLLARGQAYREAVLATSRRRHRCVCGYSPSTSATAFRPTTLLLCSRHRREAPVSGRGSSAPPAAPCSERTLAPSAASQPNQHTAELLRSIARRGGGTVRRARHGTPVATAAALSALLRPTKLPAKKEAIGSAGGTLPSAPASGKRTERVTTGSPLLRVFDAAPAPLPTVPPRSLDPESSPSAGPIAKKLSGAGTPRAEKKATPAASALAKTYVAAGDAAPSVPKSTPPSRALLHKLLYTIRADKRIRWDTLSRLHPEVLRMPLYACRHEWCEDYCARGSATPMVALATTDSAATSSSPAASVATTAASRRKRLDPRHRLPPLLLCAASTGTGKSVLIPLYALDAHWAVLEQRLVRTIEAYDSAATIEVVEKMRGNLSSAHVSLLSATAAQQSEAAEAVSVASQPFPLDSQESFIREFTACSRLRIVVSQPTRVACAELAAYTSLLLDSSRTGVRGNGSFAATPGGGGLSSDADQRLRGLPPLGRRVGFAVGGESCFCRETEIVFATPGYALNALQLSHPQSSPSLSPTTLVVDEAHCRDVETDALLAWMKMSRACRPGADASALAASTTLPVLRQYYVLSATMNLQAMDAYLCRGLQHGNRTGSDAQPVRQEGGARGLARTVADGDALPANAEEADRVPEGAPLLLLSPMQRLHVRRWWQRGQPCGHGAQIDGADADSAVARAVATDRRVRAAVLQLVEASEGYGECDDGARGDPLPVDGAATMASEPPAGNSAQSTAGVVFASGAQGLAGITAAAESSLMSPSGNPSELRSADGEAIVIATKPYRVERYFVDDLDPVDGCFARSQVLFDEAARRHAATTPRATSARTPSHAAAGAVSAGRRSGRQPVQGGTAAPTASAAGVTQWPSGGFPMCLTDDGAALRARLVDLHGTRAASYAMLSTHARALVELILQLLQAARYRWIDGAAASGAKPATPSTPQSPGSEQLYHAGAAACEPGRMATEVADLSAMAAPITVLVFVAGIGELHQIMLALERLCDTVQPSSLATSQSTHVADASAPSTLVLRHGAEVFSVGLLHSTAVGSPQEQLRATERSGAPLRLLLSTNVAESSLTIANTRIVVDTCLERRISIDDVTGAAQVLTAFASPSGLRQRCGRVGRTGDGVVIHLAPRRFVLPQALPSPPPSMQAAFPPSSTAGTSEPPPATLALEALPDGAATVLLRLKFLFAKVSDALAALPSPPSASATRLALQQLVDMDLLLLPEVAETSTAKETARDSAYAEPCVADNAAALDSDGSTLFYLLDRSVFTPKGHFVASLPLPYEHATLVYHGLQFRCVEDALMIACAMTVPSLFLTPRVSSRSTIQVGSRRSTHSDYATSRWDVDRKAALSPLEQYYRHLWAQRLFAGFLARPAGRPAASPSGGNEASAHCRRIGNSSSSDADEHAGHLSEPLVLRAVLRQWYSFSNVDDCIRLQNAHGLNRSAMRQVDNAVAQTCGRLIRMLLPAHTGPEDDAEAAADAGAAKRFVTEDAEAEVDFSAYVCHAGAPAAWSTSGTPTRGGSGRGSAVDCIPFCQGWPPETRAQLLRSLRRLQRVAVGRVHLHHTELRQRYGLPQWCDSEEQRIQLWGRPYLYHRAADRAGSLCGGRGLPEETREAPEAVRRHPCFTYWADGLPALRSHYPSLYAQQRVESLFVDGAITSSRSSVPPPLSTRVTRSKVPVYRPPAPPPPIPPVVFVMGRSEDRLCAAFVAAFGHRTLRGEDGGHRFHHRRLLRNAQTMGNDEEHVCSFHIDVQQQQQQPEFASASVSSGNTANVPGILHGTAGVQEGGGSARKPPARAAPLLPSPSSYDFLRASGVTSKSVEEALSPYLRGAGLQQLELFQSNRLAVAARFASDGFSSLFDSVSPGSSAALPANVDPAKKAGEEGSGVGANGSGATSMQEAAPVRDGRRATAGGARRAEGQSGVSNAEATPSNTRSVSAEGAHAPPADDLLKAVVLPSRFRYTVAGKPTQAAASSAHDTSAGGGHPYVHLAPFGVSLLTAAAAGTGGGGGGRGLGGLQRIPLAGAPSSGLSSRTESAQPSSPLAEAHSSSASLARHAGSGGDDGRSVRFSEVSLPSNAAAPQSTPGSVDTSATTTTTCITWPNSLGVPGRSVSRAAVEALGLADLFPTPPPPSYNVSPLHSRGTQMSIGSGEDAAAGPAASSAAEILPPADGAAAPPALTISVVPPIYITRSITWKVPLPALIPTAASMAHAARDGSPDSAEPPVHYCVLCNHIYSSHTALHQHYRSASHLEHLYHAVQLGLRREHIQTLYGWAPRVAGGGQSAGPIVMSTSDHPGSAEGKGSSGSPPHHALSAAASLPLVSLLCLRSATRLPLTQHVYPCVVSAQSFLNCLQWSYGGPPPSHHEHHVADTHKAEGGGAGADRATPLAVAGSLVALQSVTDVLPPPHLRQSTGASRYRGGAGMKAAPPASSVDAETLSAHHVWVLNLSNSADVIAASSATARPPMSALLVVAGYLATASPRAAVALLLNGAHTHLHAVMLHGLGVWRLPTPLPMQAYMGLLEHIVSGGGWPGVLIPLTSKSPDSRQRRVRAAPSPGTHGPSDGLHWCVPEAVCPLTTGEHCCNPSKGERTVGCDAVVEATLLLALHEYLQARRNMVTLADYVERVMRKLQASPFVVPSTRAVDEVAHPPRPLAAAEVLAGYFKRVRRGQTIQELLRDLGCVFATPPRALAALMRPATPPTSAKDAEGRGTAAQGGLGEVHSREASLSPTAALSKRLSYRALNAEGAAVEMMFRVPPALPSRLPPVAFAAQLRQFYADRHAHRWALTRPASAKPTRTGSPVAPTSQSEGERLAKSKLHTLYAREGAGRLRRLRKGTGVTDDEESQPQF